MIYKGQEVYGVIYKLTSPSGKVYVGQTTMLERRWDYYRRLSCKHQRQLHKALVKYGWDSFIKEVVDYAYDKEYLDFLECLYIGLNNSIATGYNSATGGANSKHSPETIAKMRESKRGHTVSPETRAKLRLASLGHRASAEARAAQSLAQLGHTVSQETREKLRITSSNRTPEARAKMSMARRLRGPASDTTKARMAAAAKAAWVIRRAKQQEKHDG
jgi:group I intron endonuclease